MYNTDGKISTGTMILKRLKKIVLFPLACINTVVFIIVYFPVLLLLVIPVFLYQKVVYILSKIFLPGSTMLANLDNLMAHGTVYQNKGLYVVLQLNFEGRMDYKGFIDRWEDRVMQLKTPEGTPKFPELKCYIQSWLGYSFYKTDEDFRLENHIKLYENPENSKISRDEIDKIRMDFTDKLFEKKRSPWEILIVNNYESIEDQHSNEKEFSVVILKIHHCMADGYATLLLFWEAFSGQSLDLLNKPKAASLKKSLPKKVLTILSAVFYFMLFVMRMPFYYIYDIDKLYLKSAWHDNKHKSDMLDCTLKPIDSAVIKEISRQHNVSVTSTLIAVCTGGFRRMMVAKEFPAPESIRSTFSLPLANHPPRLTTHSFVSEFEVPISNLEDKKRVQLIERNMKIGVRTSLIVAAPISKFLLFSLPVSFEKIGEGLEKKGIKCTDSMALSTVPLPPPSPPSGAEMVGCRLAQVYNTVDMSFTQNIGHTFFILKYRDQFFILFGIQRYLIKDQKEVYDIEKYIAEELAHLQGLSVV